MTTENVFAISDEVGACQGAHPDDGEKCLEPLTHPVEVCEVCGTPVRWVESVAKHEKQQKFGPKDELGIQALAYISRTSRLRAKNAITHFRNAEQLKVWNAAIAALDEQEIRDTVNYCGTLRKGWGWVDYLINSLRVKIESLPDEPEWEDDDAGDIP